MCAASIWTTACSPHGEEGALLIDSSTIDIDSARAVHAAAEKAGFDFLDAPVSGGVGGAEAATLTFMCGGSDKAFARARPVLEKMGKRIVLAGGAGAGQAAKICNNMLLAISMIGTCEAFVLGGEARARSAEAFRHHVHIVGPMLVADDLLPRSGTGADVALQSRLSRAASRPG